MKNKVEIVDNYLSKENFKIIEEITGSSDFAWFYCPHVATIKDTHGFYLSHIFFDKNQIFSSHFKNISFLWKPLNARALLRVKANLYTSTNKLIVHNPHKDYPFENQGMVYSINDCDGYTFINNKKYASKKNRAIFFEAGEYHSSTTCTDTEVRRNININYIK